MKVLDIGVGKIGVAESLGDAFPLCGLDAALVAQSMTKEVRLDKEISGVTSFAASCAALSVPYDYPILCGCGTRLGDMRHVSVMTFARGRLVDIADRTFSLDGGDFGEGNSIKILRLKKFDMGLLVDTDILLAKNWRKIAPHCAAVVGIAFKNDADFCYVPTLSSLFGKPYAAAFATGDIMWGVPD